MRALEVTTVIGCTIQCDYCPQHKIVGAYAGHGYRKYLPLGDFEAILRKLPTDVLIHFSGMAEPWLNPECTEMVLLADRRGHELSVFTTAVGMTREDVARIKAIRFRDFVVHLPDIEGHAKIVGNERYLETLEAIVQGGIAGCKFMTMGTLPKDVRAIVGRRIRATRMMSRAGNTSERVGLTPPPRLVGEIRCRSCGDLFDHNVLLPNGDVILCCMDYGMTHVLGNLLTSDYDSLFSGDEFSRLRSGLTDESIGILCRHCENASRLVDLDRPKKEGLLKRLWGKLKIGRPPGVAA